MPPLHDKTETTKTPRAKQIPEVTTVHGDTRLDNYAWLRDRDNPEVLKYIEAENDYTEEVMKESASVQKKLYQEIKKRIDEDDQSVPEKIGAYFYYTKTEKGLDYPIYCRRRDDPSATEEIILDQNRLAEGYDYCDLGVFEVSPSGRYLAYSVDTTGQEIFTIYVKDLYTGELLTDTLSNTHYSLEWGKDDSVFYYTIFDELNRPYRVYEHLLGDNERDDRLLYEELDSAFSLWLEKTKDRQHIICQAISQNTTELRYLSLVEGRKNFKLIQRRIAGMEYYVESWDGWFFVMTNYRAPNFKLVKTRVREPQLENWQEVFPYNDYVKISDFDIFEKFLVLYERASGIRQIRVIDLETMTGRLIDLPEEVYSISQDNNPDFKTTILRFTYSSFLTPDTVYEYDMESGELSIKKQEKLPTDFTAEDFVMDRVYAVSHDGTRVPISIVHHRDCKRDSSNPVFLYGYGSYSESEEPHFSYSAISLLNRGFIYAIAHIRGGGVMGGRWYEAGKLLNKKNSFHDFIACAEYFVKKKYTTKDKIAIYGGSAGGLLVGAVTNMRPDLFRAVVADVPFVDTLNTMLDPAIPFTVMEYDEWGDPNRQEYYEYIKSYSPYDNVARKNYPAMLIKGAFNDRFVPFWEPLKWVAKLREYKTDQNNLLLKLNMGTGHSGPSGRYDYIRDIAFEYAFVLREMGLDTESAD